MLRVFMRIVNNCTLLLVFFEIFFLSDLSANATSYRRVWRLLYIVPTTEPSSPLCYDDVELSRWYIYIQKKRIDTFSVRRRMQKWNSFIYEMTIRNKVIVLKQRWWVFFIGSIRIHYPFSWFGRNCLYKYWIDAMSIIITSPRELCTWCSYC